VGALDEDLKAACLRALEIAKNPGTQPGSSPWAIPGGMYPAISEEYRGRARPRVGLTAGLALR